MHGLRQVDKTLEAHRKTLALEGFWSGFHSAMREDGSEDALHNDVLNRLQRPGPFDTRRRKRLQRCDKQLFISKSAVSEITDQRHLRPQIGVGLLRHHHDPLWRGSA